MKHHRIKVFLVVILIMGLLAGCQTNKETNSEQSYIKYNKTTELWEISEKAFKDAKSINRDKIEQDTPNELYIALFGFGEFKNITYGMSKVDTDDPRKNITFIDSNDKEYYIFDTNGRITLRQKPVVTGKIKGRDFGKQKRRIISNLLQ
ncbi:hypothetical protein Amet_3562 [Alkaliphilus metalliredigens QYMF]|uniref:Lipoprotein n=2 Tax=Alkaliphilus TaxID=114627 RepID=A6TU16_ALKMQ|nr:hypothetical protein Amet_3562 [Alkaliphilus metalliredigens QYMF]